MLPSDYQRIICMHVGRKADAERESGRWERGEGEKETKKYRGEVENKLFNKHMDILK